MGVPKSSQELMESYFNLGSLKSKMEDALENRRQLTVKQRQQALELLFRYKGLRSSGSARPLFRLSQRPCPWQYCQPVQGSVFHSSYQTANFCPWVLSQTKLW